MTNEILILLIAFQIKHLIADYYLQFPYMYKNKGKEKGWLKPLFDHAGTHAIGTFAIIFIYHMATNNRENENLIILIYLVIFDFTTHFIIDRWKATRKGGPDTTSFWQYLGIDQMAHHIAGIFIIWSLV